MVNKLMDKATGGISDKVPKELAKVQDTVKSQLPKAMDKVPDMKTIQDRICGNTSMDSSKDMFNKMGDSMSKAKDMIEKLKALIDKVKAIINKVKTFLETILSIADVINTIIKALKTVITGLKAGVTGMSFVPSTVATPMPVGPVLLLKDGIKKADDTLKLFSNVVKGIVKKVEFIIPKLTLPDVNLGKLDGMINSAEGLLNQSKGKLDTCMKNKLATSLPPADVLDDGVDGGVDPGNQTLESLIDKENKNQGIKIEEWGYEGFPRTEEYNVRNVPPEELES